MNQPRRETHLSNSTHEIQTCHVLSQHNFAHMNWDTGHRQIGIGGLNTCDAHVTSGRYLMTPDHNLVRTKMGVGYMKKWCLL